MYDTFNPGPGNVDKPPSRLMREMLRPLELGNGDEVEAALQLLQDAPGPLTVFEQTLAFSETAVLTDEAVALLRWSSNLSCGGGWRGSDAVRTPVFNF